MAANGVVWILSGPSDSPCVRVSDRGRLYAVLCPWAQAVSVSWVL